MIIPVRCFTCGKVMADKYDYYVQQVHLLSTSTSTPIATSTPISNKAAHDKEKVNEKKKDTNKLADKHKHFDTLHTGQILDDMGLTRYCCRRHMLTTVDMMDVI